MEIQTDRIGPIAFDILAQCRSGQCIARFDQSAYVKTPAGLLWLILPENPMGPFSACVRSLPALNAHLTIDARLATVWQPPKPAPATGRNLALAPLLEQLGRGEGLTPEGDDYIVGYLLAAHALGLPIDQQRVIDAAREKTNEIAQAHLQAAARGMGLSVFHDALSALLRGDGGDPAIAAAQAIGASSGKATLRGMAECLKAHASGGAGRSGERSARNWSR